MIPAFVAKDAVRRVCREVAGGALIGAVGCAFAFGISEALDAPMAVKIALGVLLGECVGGYVAASWVSTKF